MNVYQTGQIIPEFRGRPDGLVFDMDDSGATLLLLMDRPTVVEKSSVKAHSPLRMAFVKLSGLLVILARFGSLNWMDAPYNPHLSPNLTTLADVPDGQGYALYIILVDTATGRIEHQRLVGLPTEFSRHLRSAVESLKSEPFSQDEYAQAIQRYQIRPTNQLVQMAAYHCTIQGKEEL